MYIIHQKRDHPIIEFSHKIETFPSKNTLSWTTIVGEAQEQIQPGYSMDESSSLGGVKLYKCMVIFICSYIFI